MSKKILLLAGSLMLFFTLSACGQATVETTTTPPTPTTAVTSTPEPIPDGEGIPDVEPAPLDWEEPPVTTVYNPDADLNNDGHVDKEEWEKRVAAYPADINKDLVVTDDEQGVYTASQEQLQKPSETTKPKPTEEPSTTTPVIPETPPSTPPAPPSTPPAPPSSGLSEHSTTSATADDFLNWKVSDQTQEEIDAGIAAINGGGLAPMN